ncbi:MAG: ferrochelatase [Pseudomonadota bacterium]
MRFAKEPAVDHGRDALPSTAILLCNLGTPDAPTPAALRRYLAEFLSDPRVVEIPRLVWKVILHGIILRVRPAKSAHKYATVWTPEGSPLKVWTEKQAKLLQGYLGERGHPVTVRPAMRYGSPGIPAVLDKLKQAGVRRILVLPLYPQYAGPTTGSVCDAVFTWGRKIRHLPELRFVTRYHDDPGYIDALAQQVTRHWARHGRGEKLVVSFHGVPHRTLMLGDPYHCECRKTARLLAERLALKPSDMVVTFQSRFGRARWLEPYTEPTLIALAGQGVKHVDVMCPGFTSDCLETLEEISQEAKVSFLAAGGTTFNYIPCLNDQHEWMVALAGIAQQHLAGWPLDAAPDPEAAPQRQQRARALGAAH